MPRQLSSRLAPKGFTLVELLVVIAIIALLLSILVPSLSAARARAKTVYCTANLRELSRCAILYTVDWEKFPPCLDNYTASGLPVDRPGIDWLGIGNQGGGGYAPGNPLDPTTGNPKGFLAAPKFGLLYKYFQNDKIVLCPSDSPSDRPGNANPNEIIPLGNGQFSYTMLAGMGLRVPTRIPASYLRRGTHADPALAPIFVEENPAATGGVGGINQANMEGNCWNQDRVVQRHAPFLSRPGRKPGTGNIINLVQGVTNMGFADGHAESIKTNYGINYSDMTTMQDIIPNHVQGFVEYFGVRTWIANFADSLELIR